MNEKSLFDKFPNLDDASELINILEEENIEFSIVENAFDVDITFTGNKISGVQIILDSADFERVEKLKIAKAEAQVDLTDKTHYLFKFSTKELYEIIEKRDEWSSYDYAFAKKLLEERGENISDEFLETLRGKRNEDLDKPEKSTYREIRAGYISAFLGGLLGIIIGWYLWKSKKTNTNGEKVFAYSETDRKHGLNITILGIVILSFIIIYRVVIFLKGVS
ncbi:MAG: hypothetical protein GQ574_15255 [Crocinitomix sp.]|nr:hypothetical protein [Crocinitomix sp.]